MILNHSIINIEGEQIAEKILEEQLKYNIKQTFYSIVKSVSKERGVNINVAETIRKPTWKKLIKQKIKGRIQKKLCKEIRDKTKCKSIKDDKWERKVIKDIKNLHTWDLNMNYIKEEKQPLCPLCKTENDIAKHVLQCRRDEERTKNEVKLNTVEESEKVVQIC